MNLRFLSSSLKTNGHQAQKQEDAVPNSAVAEKKEPFALDVIDGGLLVRESVPENLEDLHGLWVADAAEGLDAIARVMATHKFVNQKEGDNSVFVPEKLSLRGGRSLETAEMWHPGDENRRAGQYRVSIQLEPVMHEGRSGFGVSFSCWQQGHRG